MMLILRCLLIGFLSGSLVFAQGNLLNGVIVRPNTDSPQPTVLTDSPQPTVLLDGIARTFALLSLTGGDDHAQQTIATVLAKHGCQADILTELMGSSVDELFMMEIEAPDTLDPNLLYESSECLWAKEQLNAIRRGDVTENNWKTGNLCVEKPIESMLDQLGEHTDPEASSVGTPGRSMIPVMQADALDDMLADDWGLSFFEAHLEEQEELAPLMTPCDNRSPYLAGRGRAIKEAVGVAT